ncbi:hypothetical protein EDB19DRAFT_1910792 [Suillus lakei]|nr:hypothetical protein EDB19DRAFT_1910792 [Suillus lakei]
MSIDDINTITPKRESAQREMEQGIVEFSTHVLGEGRKQASGQSYSQLYGLGKFVFTLVATNRSDMTDPAMAGPGRLLYVDPPCANECAEIVRNVPFSPTESGAETILQGTEHIVRIWQLSDRMDDNGGGLEDDQPQVLVVLEDFVRAQDMVDSNVSVVQRKKYEVLRAKFASPPVRTGGNDG